MLNSIEFVLAFSGAGFLGLLVGFAAGYVAAKFGLKIQ